MVDAHPTDAITPLDAQRPQSVAHASNSFRELTVAAAMPGVDHCGPLRHQARPPLDPGTDPTIAHLVNTASVPTSNTTTTAPAKTEPSNIRARTTARVAAQCSGDARHRRPWQTPHRADR